VSGGTNDLHEIKSLHAQLGWHVDCLSSCEGAATPGAPNQETAAMSITQLSQSLMPFLQDFLFDGMRARLAPGRLLPHPRDGGEKATTGGPRGFSSRDCRRGRSSPEP
jgi:hypothetical protein